MAKQSLQVFTDSAGRFFISKDDHRRYCDGLLALARPLGGNVEAEMRRALADAVMGEIKTEETAAYFGSDLPVVQEVIRPLLDALRNTLPDFDIWMTVTKFGDDCDFILALLNWQRVLTGTTETPRGVNRARILQKIAARLRAMHAPSLKPAWEH
jgi:hypothetical protein